MTDNTHAAGQMQGYMLQVRHMLFELISHDDKVVSIEKLDDIAIEEPNGSVVAEQIKSVTSDNNPITDRSIVFWKTMHNWLDYIRNGNLPLEKSLFRMVVVSNHQVKTGDFIQQFHKASTKAEALIALKNAQLSIWGKDDVLKSDVPDSYGKYLEKLFSDDNSDFVTQIIVKFSLIVHENDYDEKLIEKFNRQPIFAEFADSLFIYMLGWVNEKVNEYIKEGLPAMIATADYNIALVAQSRMYSQKNSIPALSMKIAPDEARTFV